VVLAAVFIYRDHVQDKRDAAHLQQANVDQAGANADAGKGNADVTPMQDERKQVAKDTAADQANDPKLAADRARVASFDPRPLPGPGSPKVPAPEPVVEPPESPRELAKDQLITDLTTALAGRDKTIADQAKLNATTTDYGQHEHAAYAQDAATVGELRQANHPTFRRAAGLLYAPGQSAVGVIVEQDIARVRVVGELIQQGLPAMAGGRNQTLALIGAAITF